jgi:hypothetical protein
MIPEPRCPPHSVLADSSPRSSTGRHAAAAQLPKSTVIVPQQLNTNQHFVHITYSLLVTPYTRFELSLLLRPWLWNAPNTPQCWYASTAKGATLLAARETCRHMVATPYTDAHIGDVAAESGRRCAERSCQTGWEVEH